MADLRKKGKNRTVPIFSFTNRKGLRDRVSKAFRSVAGGKGFEPLFTESESVVLPLNDPPITS